MPLLKSSIKRARQNPIRRDRRTPFKSNMRTMLRSFLELVKDGKVAEAQALLPKVMKSIDTATKKKIIHRNNASRKKSRLARMIAKK